MNPTRSAAVAPSTRRRNRAALLFGALLIGTLVIPGPTAVLTSATPEPLRTTATDTSLDLAADPHGMVHLNVWLKTPGISTALSAGEATNSFATLTAQTRERADARTLISALGGTIEGEFRHLFNGLRVRLPARALASLRSDALVDDIQLVTRFQRAEVTGGTIRSNLGITPSNAGATTAVQANSVWAETATSKAGTGFGVSVAVIDSGIDYTHADFVRDENVAFPTTKVIDGYDLVGDDYSPGSGWAGDTPRPDGDPMDCSTTRGGGHGTHVAGTIAGYGIKDGRTYGSVAGEYYQRTTNLSAFTLAPGVAPLASLIAVRIFGCEGGTDLVADGIEKAVALGAKVINLSLGAPYGIRGGAEQAAINAAEAAGVTVVVAAGNQGQKPFLVGSPSTEDGGISVAALDDRPSFPAARISYSASGVDTYVGGTTGSRFLNANLFDFSAPLASTLISLFQSANPSRYALGCPAQGDNGETYTPDWEVSRGDLSGKVVILRDGTCTVREKVSAMLERGASGVIILQRADLIAKGDLSTFPPFQGPGSPTAAIPVLMANGTTESTLTSALAVNGLEGGRVNLTDHTATVANPRFRTVAPFTSGGPRWGDLALKPEVSAPGTHIVSAASGTGSGVAWMSGTSMATPVVSGVAALVLQVNPTWGAALVKSAVINTATSIGSKVPLRLVGAGRVNARAAVLSKVTIDAGPNATLSFGMVYGTASTGIARSLTFKVSNRGASAVTYKFVVGAAAGFSLPYGVAIRVYEGTALLSSSRGVYLTAGRTKTLTVRLTASIYGQRRFPRQMAATTTGLSGGIDFVITASATGRPTLRVPGLAYLRHVEQFAVTESRSGGKSTITSRITTGVNDVQSSGGVPQSILLSPYVWLLQDPREGSGNGSDIKNIGFNAKIGRDWASSQNGFVQFLITSWDRSWNAAMNEYQIVLDADLNGIDDQVLVITDKGSLQGGRPNGVIGCFFVDQLNWLNGGGGEIYELEASDCSVNAPLGSSALSVQVNQDYLYESTNVKGVSFSVATFDGRGNGEDSTSRIFVSFNEVATAATYSATTPCLIGGGASCKITIAAGRTTGSTTAPYVGIQDDAWGTANRGWLLWNDWNAGPSTEIYEAPRRY